MVTVQEARSQLTQQQQILSKAKTQIKEISLPPISVAQLRVRGRAQIIQREARERELQIGKERELTKLKPAEQELQRAEKEVVRFEQAIKEQQRQRIAFDAALKVFFSKDPRAIFFLSKLEKKFFQKIQAGRQSALKKSIDEAIATLKAKGVKEIKPIFKEGTRVLTGFEGIIIPTPKPKQVGLPPERLQVFELPPVKILGPPKPKPDIFKRLVPGFPIGIPIGFPGPKFVPISDLTQAAFAEAEKRGFSKERIADFIVRKPEEIDKLAFLNPTQRSDLKKLQGFSRGVILGSLRAVEERPEKILTITAASFLLPEVTAGIEGLAFTTSILNKIPAPIRKRGGQVLGAALGTLYLASAGLEIAGELTTELKGEKLGEILTTEVAPFIIGTRLGVAGILRRQVKSELEIELKKLPPSKRAAFEDYMKQAELFGRFEPTVRNIELKNINSIKSIGAQRALRSFLRANKKEITVGGSVAQTGQLRVRRALNDVDLYLEGRLTPNLAAKQLAREFERAGIKRVSSIRGQVTIDGRKAVEFHNIERLLTNIKQVTPSWQNPRRYIIKTPEGIKIQRIGLQAKRKLVAAFADPRRIASGKFRKDLKDFKVIADSLFKRAELSARGSFFFRESQIKRLERISGKKITRKLVEIPSLFKKPTKPLLFKKSPIIKAAERKLKPFQVVGIKKKIPSPLKVKKVPFKKLSERGPSQIIRRAKIKASQKPFSQLAVKRVIPPSQIPFKPKKPPTIIPPSQIPFKPKKITTIITTIFGPPSQPPIVPTKPTVLVPPSQPPFVPTKPPVFPPTKVPPPKFPPSKVPFLSRTTKKQPLRIKPGGEGYLAFVREVRRRVKTIGGRKVQQPRRLLQINKVPTSKARARDAMAFLVDNTLSSFGKIKRVPGKARPLKLNIPQDYFKRTRFKYRSFRIRKGQRIPLKNAWIEKRGKPRLDTSGEKRKILAFKKIAQLRRQKKARFPKLKSTRFKKIR